MAVIVIKNSGGGREIFEANTNNLVLIRLGGLDESFISND